MWKTASLPEMSEFLTAYFVTSARGVFPLSASDKLKTSTDVLKNVVYVGGFISMICTTVFTGCAFLGMQFVWPAMVKQLAVELNVATKSDVSALSMTMNDNVEKLSSRIDSITGDDRILKVHTNRTFIEEPVIVGEKLVLNPFAAIRTENGADCVALDVTPLFTDTRGVPFSGKSLTATQQVTTELSPMFVELDMPEKLTPGRVALQLSIHYKCPFGPGNIPEDKYEVTDPIYFQLISGGTSIK